MSLGIHSINTLEKKLLLDLYESHMTSASGGSAEVTSVFREPCSHSFSMSLYAHSYTRSHIHTFIRAHNHLLILTHKCIYWHSTGLWWVSPLAGLAFRPQRSQHLYLCLSSRIQDVATSAAYLQHTPTYCNTFATHCNTLPHTTAHYSTLHQRQNHSSENVLE